MVHDDHPATRDWPEYTTILLHEYDSLRGELQSRNNLFVTMVAAVAAVGVGLATVVATAVSAWPIMILYLVVLIVFWRWTVKTIHASIVNIADRLRDIERQVNTLAGKKLLVWERENGYGGLWDLRKEARRISVDEPL